MIAASEPTEFVPHGRLVMSKHPGQIYGKRHNSSLSENSLMYKLTNVAIKDDSILETGVDEEQEWWSIREVYYRDDESEDVEEQLCASKDVMSESFRPQNRTKNDFNISIKSELLSRAKKMDLDYGAPPSVGTSRGESANSSSNLSKKFNLTSTSASPTKKPLNPRTDCCYEEELYVKGHTAVWSKGLISSPGTRVSGPEHRETICCFTVDNPIKQAVFCNFYISLNNTMLIDALNVQIGDAKKNIKIDDTTKHILTEIMPSILIADNKCMRVFAKDGREYITSIPFQVKKVWPMKYGILLEKESTQFAHNVSIPTMCSKLNDSHNSSFSKSKNFPFSVSGKYRADSVSGYEDPLPTCFSLSHPLDEVTPVLMKTQSQGPHYFNEVDLQILFVSSNPSIILLYDWKLSTHSLWRIRKATRDECLAVCPNSNSSTVFSQSCDFASPMRTTKNATSGISSPLHSKKLNTPTRSRQNSLANIFQQQGLSPHGSIGQASSTSMMATMLQAPPSLPLYPDICLEHIWTDNQVIRRDAIESSSECKTFLHTDLVGHEYLCFMVKVAGASRLHIARLQMSHLHGQVSKTNLLIGSISSVPAKDAVPLDNLKMIALVDESGNILLQSGNSVVGKVHVGGVLARLIDSPYTKHILPRRSSLLPSLGTNEPASLLEESYMHILSPVPAHHSTEREDSLGVRSVRDATGSRLTLQLENGTLYRISLPAVAGRALVSRCIAALAAILPHPCTRQVMIKWYGARNAPGTQDLTPEQEWSMFADLLFTMMGYDDKPHTPSDDTNDNEIASKKQKTSSDGTSQDWEYLLDSKIHKKIGDALSNMLNLKSNKNEPPKKQKSQEFEPKSFVNSNGLLHPHRIQVLFSLHLVYEEIKLNTVLGSDMKPLSVFLYQLSKHLQLKNYLNYYWLDYPTDFEYSEGQMNQEALNGLSLPNCFSVNPPSIFSYLNSMLKDEDVGYYPYLLDVNNTSRDLIEVLKTIGCGETSGVQLVTLRDNMASSTPRCRGKDNGTQAVPYVQLLWERGYTPRDIDNFPPAISMLLLTMLCRAKSSPPVDWPAAAYRLVMREDLALQAEIADTVAKHTEYMESHALGLLEKETAFSSAKNNTEDTLVAKVEEAEPYNATGMEHLNTKLLSLLYPRDHRMAEVINLLQSSSPVTINIPQRPGVNDHDFLEEQEKYLFAYCTRTMALPVARGMLTLRSLPCSPTEPVTIPKLNVSGRGAPPRSNTVNLGSDVSPNSLVWPSFHNGVAAGLALVPVTGTSIDSSWVIYNKPRGTHELSAEHAGFLLGLGLNGHLRDMPFMNIYEYLVKCNEMISTGLLLGLAATYRGTMNTQATKMLSIHVESLLPPTSIELDIQQGILVCALLGVGLVFQGTQHQHHARQMLQEIGKPPALDQESCVEREGYALAAGLALGFICVGAGHSVTSDVLSTLRTYMLGGDRHPLSGHHREKFKLSSNGVREGSIVNLDVTSPGATLALGLMYLKCGPCPVAQWLEPPSTPYALDTVRPDALMLRIIARGLILWDSIEASEQWIDDQVPSTIKPYCFVKPTEDNIDYEAMNQAYCNIVAGASFAMGLRFAGSGDEDARDAVMHYAKALLTIWGKRVGELAGRAAIETCLCVCLLAAGMIMAGRGDISVLRLCRRLRARVIPNAPHAPHALTHGGQMAVHCTIGLLFLGGGRATLSTAPTAIAALLAAFFPKFPTHSEDNRYHLQAFRHLYVLAVEPRLILPRDLDTGKLCFAHLQVVDLSGAVKKLKAPCIIPELESLSEVRIEDPRYWTINFQRDRNWDQLKTFLEYTWCVDVKQRAGCLSYLDDPQGFLSLLAQTLTLDKSNIWSVTPDNIELFTNDDKIKNFVKHYLNNELNFDSKLCAECFPHVNSKKIAEKQCHCRKYSKEEQEYIQRLNMVTYECVVKDILCALPVWMTFLKIMKTMKSDPTTYNVWQIKILLSQIDCHNKRLLNEMKIDGQEHANEPLISNEFTVSIKEKVASICDSWEREIMPYLRKYLGLPSSRNINVCEERLKKVFSAFLVYYDLNSNVSLDFHSSEVDVVLKCANFEGISKVLALMR